MKLTSFVSTSICAIILALTYTAVGIIVSFCLYYIFDEYDEKWKKRSTVYHIADVTVEIAILAIISFWSSVIIESSHPLLPVPRHFESLLKNYSSGLFFFFAIFIFMDDLTNKLQHIHHINLAPYFDCIFPKHGSLIDLSLSYTPRKTDKTNSTY